MRAGEPTVVAKLMVTDSRVVRGFAGAPVDGTLTSGSWDGRVWEYNLRDGGGGRELCLEQQTMACTSRSPTMPASMPSSFAAGPSATCDAMPPGMTLPAARSVHRFPGQSADARAFFKEPIKTNRVSFFNTTDGQVADCSFYRVSSPSKNAKVETTDSFPWRRDKLLASIEAQLADRFTADQRTMYTGDEGRPEPIVLISLAAGKAVHLLTGAGAGRDRRDDA